MNKNTTVVIIVILLILIGSFVIADKVQAPAAVEPGGVIQSPITSGENAEPGNPVHGLPAEPAAEVARADLAAKLSVDKKSIVIMKVEEKTWTDGCLGLGGPAESCLAALVEGFRVELLAAGKTYVYRTDKTGTSVRMEVQ